MSIAETISKNTTGKTLISVLGGGDTLAAINKSKNKLSFSHLSTAGGAFLEYLEGKTCLTECFKINNLMTFNEIAKKMF